MLRAAHGFAVGVAEVPPLPLQNEPAHELAVDELGPPARGATSAAHSALSDDRGYPSARAAVGGVRVLPLIACSCEIPAHRREQKR